MAPLIPILILLFLQGLPASDDACLRSLREAGTPRHQALAAVRAALAIQPDLEEAKPLRPAPLEEAADESKASRRFVEKRRRLQAGFLRSMRSRDGPVAN